MKHFLEEVPVPPEGTTAIKFHIGLASLCFARSNPSDYPCIQTAVAPLLASFPAKVAVQLLVAVASEHRVLLVSSQMHMLTIVAESLRVLLFPFKFCHTYIPVLPSSMLSFIHRTSHIFLSHNAGVDLYVAESQPYILGIMQDDVQRVSIPKSVLVAYIDSHCVERAEQMQAPEPESSWLAEAFQALQPGLGAVPSSIAPVSSSINVSRDPQTLFFGVKVHERCFPRTVLVTLDQALAQEESELQKLTRRQSASSGPSLLCNPQVEWFDRVVVPFTSVEGPNEGGSAFGVERAIRAVTIAFWASLLLNFRRALRPSAGLMVH